MLWCVQVPNGFGCGLGALQLILYFVYRDNKGNDKGIDTKKQLSAEDTMELGLEKPHQSKQSNGINGV